MDSLYVQFQREYLTATQQVRQSLAGRTGKMNVNNEALLEELKFIVSLSPSYVLQMHRHALTCSASQADLHSHTQVGKLKMEARTLPADMSRQKLQEVTQRFSRLLSCI